MTSDPIQSKVHMELSSDEERAIIHYLLGEMSESERDAFEAAFFSDDASVEKLEIVRDELVDRYAMGRLSEGDRRRFQSHFLESPYHRHKLELAVSLISSLETESPGAAGPSDTGFFSRRKAAFAIAAAVVLLALAGLFLFRVFQTTTPTPIAGSANENSNSDGARSTPDAQRTPEPTVSQNRSQDQRKPAGAATPLVAELNLVPRANTSQTPTLVIGAGVSEVYLNIPQPEGDFSYYIASISPVGGKEIWFGRLSPSTGPRTSLNVPATLLSRQDYVVTINGVRDDGSREEIQGYYFRVTRR